MTGERERTALFRHLSPTLHPDEFVFVSVPADQDVSDVDTFARVREAEGVTLILPAAEAARAGLSGQHPSRAITLGVHSDLAAVGFIAAVATDLAAAGISTNVVSAFHHDHLFVPSARAEDALAILSAYAIAAPRSRRVPSGVAVRRSREVDLDALRTCFEAVAREGRWLARLEPPPRERMAEFLRTLEAGAGVQFLALRGDRVVGWCDIHRKPYPAFEHSGVLGMAVLKEERGRGIGAALLAAALDAAQHSG